MSPKAYHNEHDPYAAQWLRNLIAKGLIAPGDVDERDIRDVRADDLKGYTQCHFFAGIGGWPLAFRLAGIPDSAPVWSGSCPCPPWSRARIHNLDTAGMLDERDLWPTFFKIIDAARPARLAGEQVAGSKVKPWIERTKHDLAGINYHFKSDTRRAKDYGSPQGRERFFFLADLGGTGGQGLVERPRASKVRPWRWGREADLRALAAAPFESGNCWPQPIVRSGDDGLSSRVGRLRAYGNAIDPYVAAEFIQDFFEVPLPYDCSDLVG